MNRIALVLLLVSTILIAGNAQETINCAEKGYSQFKKGFPYHSVNTSKMPYDACVTYCQERSGQLPLFKTEEDIEKYEKYYRGVWMGARRTGLTTYETLDGETFSVNPNNGSIPEFGNMMPWWRSWSSHWDGDGKWDENNCLQFYRGWGEVSCEPDFKNPIGAKPLCLCLCFQDSEMEETTTTTTTTTTPNTTTTTTAPTTTSMPIQATTTPSTEQSTTTTPEKPVPIKKCTKEINWSGQKARRLIWSANKKKENCYVEIRARGKARKSAALRVYFYNFPNEGSACLNAFLIQADHEVLMDKPENINRPHVKCGDTRSRVGSRRKPLMVKRSKKGGVVRLYFFLNGDGKTVSIRVKAYPDPNGI